MIKKNIRHKALYKKFLRLKVNPLTNNKFLKVKMSLKTETYDNRKNFHRKPKESLQIERFKKEKWVKFLDFLKKANKSYRKFKPYKVHSYKTSKFASQGNSFKKKFRNDLITKKIFSYMHGGLLKKYLKDRITRIYNSNKSRHPMKVSIEFFESRLDSVLYRSKFCYSIKNARQLIAHKHVKVNNRIERNKSYILKQGDLIEISSKSIEIVKVNLNRQFKERPDGIMWPMAPSYLTINYKTLGIIFGDIKNFDFSTAFTFKLDTDSLLTSHYRH